MSAITESVEVEVPVRTAYNQWTQVESFPLFMGAVQTVEQIDATHSHWTAEFGGVHVEFDAVVTEQHPDERVAWKTLDGEVDHAGVVTFHRLDADRTLVTVQMEWEPHGVVQKAGSMASYDKFQVRRDIERFKHYIETRGVETGSWRGDVPAPGQRG